MSEAELRLELACALFAQGKIGKVGGAELAGVDFSRSKARLESGASVSTPLR